MGTREKSAAVLGLSPAVMFAVFEAISGSLTDIRGIYLLLNLLFFYLVYLTVFAATNSMRISFIILNFIFTVWSLAEYYVLEFRGNPIMVWDILAFRTAVSVSGNYRYDLTLGPLCALIIILGWSALIWKFPFRLSSLKIRGISAAAAVGSCAIFFWGFYNVLIPKLDIEINIWEPKTSYSQYGYMVATLRSAEYMKVDVPEGYSLNAVRQIQSEWEEMEAAGRAGEREKAAGKIASDAGDDSAGKWEMRWRTDSAVIPTNLICIMNESFSELRKVAPFETDIPYLEFYHSLEENCVKGDLYMPVFGATTANSEFEFLTGNSIAFAPKGTVPYQLYMKNPTYGLPRILKENGYRTVAIHANYATNWNRKAAYQALGFDEFLDFDSFEDPPVIRSCVADLGDYQKIISLTEGKEKGEPLFIFDVTMQNHGGYEEEYEARVHLTEIGGMPKTEQYLSLIRESDQALQYLLGYYSQVEEPTMIVLFGDHQPAVEEEFYETLYGTALDETAEEDYLRRYITPFLIWTNYETESMLGEAMSAQYLPAAVLQRANLPLSPFLYFVSGMYYTAPVIHPMGYYDGSLVWNSWDGWKEKPEYPVFRQFDFLQYHNMFDRKRITELFTCGGRQDGGESG